MDNTLPLEDIVRINVNLSPRAVVRRGFNMALIIGTSEVIPITERLRVYQNADALIADGFKETDPEYKAALLYFSQRPTPTRLAVGRHAINTRPAEFCVENAIRPDAVPGLVLSWEHMPDNPDNVFG